MQSEWGHALRLCVFGGSHEPMLGMRLSGVPAGTPIDLTALQAFLDRRAPHAQIGSTARTEADRFLVKSGITDGMADGNVIELIIQNTDADSKPYDLYRDVPRPSQIDYPARLRFGEDVDLRGGGHFSGRMTAAYCMAGGIAMQALNRCGVRVGAHLLSVGSVFDRAFDPVVPELPVAASPLPVLDEAVIDTMQQAIADAKADGDSIGGIIECAVTGFPKGHGTPLFDGIDSRLSSLLFAVPAVRAVSFGSGFNAAAMRGSAHNDAYCLSDGEVRTETNRHGGLIGGISTGMPILFTVAIKPAASIRKPQQALHLPSGEQTTLTVSGRHDACIAVRAVPVIEAAAALALYDVLLEESHAE